MIVGDGAADGEIIVARMFQADRVARFMDQGGLAVAARLEVEIVGLVGVDEGIALNFAEVAVATAEEGGVGGRLGGAGRRVHVDDVSPGAVLLDEFRCDQIVPQLDRCPCRVPLFRRERDEAINGRSNCVVQVRIVELAAGACSAKL